jgi:hypothetical protein
LPSNASAADVNTRTYPDIGIDVWYLVGNLPEWKVAFETLLATAAIAFEDCGKIAQLPKFKTLPNHSFSSRILSSRHISQ